MNNKGQTLVLFVVIFPVIIIIFAFIFDSAYITMENNTLEDIASSSVRYLVLDNKGISEVSDVINLNDSDIEIVSVSSSGVHLKKDIEPIFGKVIGYEKYHLEVNMVGSIKDGKLILEEKGN